MAKVVWTSGPILLDSGEVSVITEYDTAVGGETIERMVYSDMAAYRANLRRTHSMRFARQGIG